VSARLKLHPQGVRGICGWCGLPVTETTSKRGWLKFWHDACSAERTIIEQPAAAREALFKRDRGVCVDCGEDWSQKVRFVPEFYAQAWQRDRAEEGEFWTLGPDGKRFVHLSRVHGAPYVSLITVSLWHADHAVPLWEVAHLPDIKRLEYFMLANLLTRCERCHIIKSREEAARRAKFDRMAQERVTKSQQKLKWGSRPMKSGNRFPPRGSRPMKGKNRE
jgi:hypothetical protein